MMKRFLKQVSARAFCCPGSAGGGNPLTVFMPKHPLFGRKGWHLTAEERSRLAQSCDWESVVVAPLQASNMHGGSTKHQQFHFYMPSGEEVSFCAHAAIGASVICARRGFQDAHDKNMVSFSAGLADEMVTHQVYLSGIENNEAALRMSVPYTEDRIMNLCNSEDNLLKVILNRIGLQEEDVASPTKSGIQDSILNASIARKKTLIPIKTLDRLHAATNPPDPEKFRDLCDSINSTGVYLYVPLEANDGAVHSAMECRQFPRFSGYPEDPATGIAAAALACHLHTRQKSSKARSKAYDCYQGSAMGRRSKITVSFPNDETVAGASPGQPVTVSLICSGSVEIMSESELVLKSSHSAVN